MWLLENLEPTSDLRMGEALTLDGPLDVQAFDRAAVRLHERHALLSSVVVHRDDGDLVQEVRPVPGSVVRLRADGPRTEGELDAVLCEEIEQGFDLARERPLRLTLHRLGPERHVLLLVLHHVAGDFWTLVLLVRDLLELYRAEREGRAPDLPPVVADFADFARAERAETEGDRLDQHRSFWREALRDAPAALPWPSDPRAAADPSPTALHPMDVPQEVADRVRALATRLGATRYQVLLAAYAVFLARHTGVLDVVVGAPATQRAESRWRDVAGYLINTVPVRVRLEEDLSFAEVVLRARDASLSAFEHGKFPFPRLVELAREEAGGSDPGPVVETLLVHRGLPVKELGAVAGMGLGSGAQEIVVDRDVMARSRDLPRRSAQYPLALSFGDVDGRLRAGWDFDPRRFGRSTMDRFSERFVELLARATASSDAPVSELTGLCERDEADLRAWNPVGPPRTGGRTLHARFLEQAERDPSATAVVCAGVRLSYGELATLARAQAASLRAHGVRPGDKVAVHLPRGWEQVVAVLGTVMCGAAYVPVDPSLPAARRTTVLEHGDVRHVLVRGGAPDLWPPSCVSGWSTVVTDVEAASDASADPVPDVPSDALAYVIFTSGSTGVPKGVMIDHASACTTLDEVSDRIGAGPDTRVLAISSLGFDLSVFDVFGVLGAGGTVVVPTEEEARDPYRWCELVRAEAVTVWNSVPALAQLAVEQAGDGSALASVGCYLLSGDWIPLPLPDAARRSSPGARVLSLGGATECSVWSIAHEVEDVDPAWASIPYGRPLTHQTFHVLDDRGRPVPPGVVGELCIGGAGVALGYVGDPERTAQAFVDGGPLGRLYRTGDLGRHGPDGVLEFLGRRDRQVKVNGFRVEIGEIESVLREDPTVEDVHVVASDASGGRRLVAFVTGPGAGAEHLRAVAARRLPAYMVPAVVHVLDAWPLTTNGKVDHTMLEDLAARRGVPEGATEEAAPEREDDGTRALVGAVRELLGGAVRATDSFLAVGGDSVTAIRVAMALRRAGLRVGADDLLVADALEDVVLYRTDDAEPLTDSVPATSEDVPLTPMQSTMYLHSVVADDPALYCEHVVLELDGTVDRLRLERAWQRVVDAEPALRAQVYESGQGGLYQRSGPLEVGIDEVRADDDLDEAVSRLVDEDRERGIDVRSGPLTWWRLVHAGGRCALVWTHHHLLLDGWSLPIVLRAVLRAYSSDGPVEPGSSHAEIARARDDARRRGAAQTAAFWQEALAVGVPGTRVPRTLPGGRFRHAEVEIGLGVEQTRALHAAAAVHRVTVSTFVEAAWASVLSNRTGDRRATFGLTLAGRDAGSDGLDEAVGMFVNTMPLVVDIDPFLRLRDWLRGVQGSALAASAHADVAISELEREVLGRDSRGGGLFDSVLVFENLPLDDVGPGGAGLVPGRLRFTEVLGMPLAVYAFPGRSLTLRLAYDSSAWDEDWAAGVLDELRAALAALVGADPDARLGRALRAQAVAAGAASDGRALRGPERERESEAADVVDRVLAESRHGPGRVAVEDAVDRYTYGELVEAAEAVASALLAAGATTEDVVSVVSPRSARGVVLLLGVLLAGAGYAPSTPGRARIVGDLVLVGSAADLPAEGVPAHVRVVVDDGRGRGSQEGGEQQRPVRRAPGSVAYVVHTSGSTGTARGVVVERGALAAFVDAGAKRYGLDRTDRVLHFATPEFDAAVEEVWCTLATGGSLVVRDETWTDSVDAFLARAEQTRCTVLDLPTAFWAEVVAHLRASDQRLPSSVRLVVVGGDAIPAGALESWPVVGASARLVNSYGPTETTVVVTTGELV